MLSITAGTGLPSLAQSGCEYVGVKTSCTTLFDFPYLVALCSTAEGVNKDGKGNCRDFPQISPVSCRCQCVGELECTRETMLESLGSAVQDGHFGTRNSLGFGTLNNKMSWLEALELSATKHLAPPSDLANWLQCSQSWCLDASVLSTC